jgi:hypothetical protein
MTKFILFTQRNGEKEFSCRIIHVDGEEMELTFRAVILSLHFIIAMIGLAYHSDPSRKGKEGILSLKKQRPHLKRLLRGACPSLSPVSFRVESGVAWFTNYY